VARQVGVSAVAVTGWEMGRFCPTHDHLVALARLFDVTVDDLLGVRRRRRSNGSRS
jgi:transcriptional regulator with XRE-family HTH domain